MKIKILEENKNFIEIEIDNLTVAELLRVYLHKNGASFAAWKREHPTKNPILRVEGQNVRKIIETAIVHIEKDLDSFLKEYKKLGK